MMQEERTFLFDGKPFGARGWFHNSVGLFKAEPI
jgi:hypothetical protein